VTCPRCGESFVPRGGSSVTTAPTVARSSSHAVVYSQISVNGAYSPTPADSIGILHGLKPLLIIAATLTLIVSAAISYYLLTASPERSTRPTTSPPSGTATSLPSEPAAIPALGFLPPAADLIIGWKPGSAESENAWNALDLIGFKSRLEEFVQNAHLSISQIALVLAALELPEDSAIPKIVVVMQLKEPLADRQAFYRAIQATRQRFNTFDANEQYAVLIAGVPLELLACDDTTYLIASEASSLTPVRGGPQDLKELPKFRCYEAIRRLPTDSLAWLATAPVDWRRKPSLKFAFRLLQREWPESALSQIRSVAAALSVSANRKLYLAVEAADADAANPLTTVFPAEITTLLPLTQRDGAWWIHESSETRLWSQLKDWLAHAGR
jgi:hypothetical protein